MQASTPHTAKKQAASTNTAADLSKTLEIQIREAKQTVAKMEEEQPQYIQEMQQQLLSLQENVQKLEKNTENLRRDLTDVDILNGTQQDKRRKEDGRKTSPMKSGTLPSNGTWRRQTLTITTPPQSHMADTCTADTKDHKLPSYTGKRIGKSKHLKTTPLRLQVVRHTQPSQNLGQEQSNSILRRATQNQLCATDHMEREINLTMQAPLHIVTKRQGSDL